MIFVTGGTGLVGSHILVYLTKSGDNFKALKRRNSSIKICKKIFLYYNLEKEFNNIHWVEGDINDIVSLEKHIKGCTQVIHAAALVSFQQKDKKRLQKINVEGTANIVNVSLAFNIEKLGYVSSIATLGRMFATEIVDEECYFVPNKLESNYALSKYYAEQEVWRGAQEGLDMVIINPSIILGAGNWDKGSSQIFQRIYSGLKFYTTGGTGYIDVIDVAKSLISLLKSDIKNKRFIVNSENLKFRDVFNRIAIHFNRPEATIKVTPFLKEIAWRLYAVKSFFTRTSSLVTKESANSSMTNNSYSSEKIKKALNFKFISINESIKRYCDWYLSELR